MDFDCYCGDTFTLNSSLQRHYQLCMVAKERAFQAASPISSSDSGSSTNSDVQAAIDIQQVNQTIMDDHRKLVEAFSAHIMTTTATLMDGISSNYMTVLQNFFDQHSELQQKTEQLNKDHRRTIEEQINEHQQKIEEQNAQHQQKIEGLNMYHQRLIEITNSKHQRMVEEQYHKIQEHTMDVIKVLKKSSTLEVTEQVLRTFKNDPRNDSKGWEDEGAKE